MQTGISGPRGNWQTHETINFWGQEVKVQCHVATTRMQKGKDHSCSGRVSDS